MAQLKAANSQLFIKQPLLRKPSHPIGRTSANSTEWNIVEHDNSEIITRVSRPDRS